MTIDRQHGEQRFSIGSICGVVLGAPLLVAALLGAGCGPATLPSSRYDSPAHESSARSVEAARASSVAPLRNAPVLIDSIHANNTLDRGMDEGNHEYHSLYSFRRTVGCLSLGGLDWEEATEGELDAARLAGRKLLLINLVSAEKAPFHVAEILAIRDFVERGGGLLVVVDHSNCYYHAHRLAPLFRVLGMEIHTDTVCEVEPHIIGRSNGWIRVTRFVEHPITRGLRAIALQTGGRIDRRFAVALTSEHAWADRWHTIPFGEAGHPGFYGDWIRGDDEFTGEMGVVAARNLGQGRIVVLGDQNMMSEPFLHYADNHRLWLNSLAWLTGEPRLADSARYRAEQRPLVLCWEPGDDPTFGRTETSGHFNAWVAISRRRWAFANDRFEQADLIVLGFADLQLTDDQAAFFAEHVAAGRSITVLDAGSGPPDEQPAIATILAALPQESARFRVEVRDEEKVLHLDGGGRIHLAAGSSPYDNFSLAPPTEKPDDAQAAREADLLRLIDAALAP